MRTRKIFVALTLVSTALVFATSISFGAGMFGSDANKGKELHAEHCVSCHDDSVYTRDPRHVNSMKGLTKQIDQCNNQLKMSLSDSDLKNIISYLTGKYYKFD